MSSLIDTTLQTAFVQDNDSDITATFLFVNTSQDVSQTTEVCDESECNATISALDTTLETVQDNSTTLAEG